MCFSSSLCTELEDTKVERSCRGHSRLNSSCMYWGTVISRSFKMVPGAFQLQSRRSTIEGILVQCFLSKMGMSSHAKVLPRDDPTQFGDRSMLPEGQQLAAWISKNMPRLVFLQIRGKTSHLNAMKNCSPIQGVSTLNCSADT